MPYRFGKGRYSTFAVGSTTGARINLKRVVAISLTANCSLRTCGVRRIAIDYCIGPEYWDHAIELDAKIEVSGTAHCVT